ncbi:MAG TPA: hypothetical protein VEQ63_07090 [Bryobacteraceae bacterium]|nr:hypothetical protein [Bryobacteraceae bacterium]
MRYWSILLGKLVTAAALLYGIWFVLHATYVPPEHVTRFNHSPFLHDLRWTTTMFLYNLLCQGVLFLIILDQRYRCRTCGRRLRMPVSTGRHSQQLLFGRPQTEYICIYGHGTLKVPELHISGIEPNKWEPHEDIWKELYSLDDVKKK